MDQNWPWDFIQAAGVLIGGAIALFQLQTFRSDQKKRSTLEACNRYDYDPVLNGALKSLRDARNSGSLETNPKLFRFEAFMVLNFLDAIAIGVFQGFYDRTVARDHMENIMRFHVEELLNSDTISKMDESFYSPEMWQDLMKLLATWDEEATRASLWRELCLVPKSNEPYRFSI